jgi:charged multivesicular body protein 1
MRKKTESLNYLKLAARVDGVKSRLETMSANQKLAQQLAGVSKALEQSTQTMNILEVAKVMDRFSGTLEDVTVMEDSIADAIDKSTASMVQQSDVDDLIRQVADEYSLEIHSLLPDLVATPTSPARVPAQQQRNQSKALYS